MAKRLILLQKKQIKPVKILIVLYTSQHVGGKEHFSVRNAIMKQLNHKVCHLPHLHVWYFAL